MSRFSGLSGLSCDGGGREPREDRIIRRERENLPNHRLAQNRLGILL